MTEPHVTCFSVPTYKKSGNKIHGPTPRFHERQYLFKYNLSVPGSLYDHVVKLDPNRLQLFVSDFTALF